MYVKFAAPAIKIAAAAKNVKFAATSWSPYEFLAANLMLHYKNVCLNAEMSKSNAAELKLMDVSWSSC